MSQKISNLLDEISDVERELYTPGDSWTVVTDAKHQLELFEKRVKQERRRLVQAALQEYSGSQYVFARFYRGAYEDDPALNTVLERRWYDIFNFYYKPAKINDARRENRDIILVMQLNGELGIGGYGYPMNHDQRAEEVFGPEPDDDDGTLYGRRIALEDVTSVADGAIIHDDVSVGVNVPDAGIVTRSAAAFEGSLAHPPPVNLTDSSVTHSESPDTLVAPLPSCLSVDGVDTLSFLV
ncbi:hypothetical protein BJV82DRAFT_640398 [Fennellomyces sp. T-0311]|nr:hypothetical protein BJV82DRAFT_640398 [Fennellomyces sp. T-0311]